MLNVEITQCANGFIVYDRNTGAHHVATKIDSYSGLDVTLVKVLQSIQEAQKPVVDPSEEV